MEKFLKPELVGMTGFCRPSGSKSDYKVSKGTNVSGTATCGQAMSDWRNQTPPTEDLPCRRRLR